MQETMKKVFELINKTGDRCIVVSPDTDEAFAILSLQEYERLVMGKTDIVDLSEDELLDKINRDIAVWKSQQDDDQNVDLMQNTGKQEFDSENSEFGENIANNSQNFDEYRHWDKDSDDPELEEEPFYFEKV
jgi:PHD/YefM family antitoxin component YafN of YafNO toxin-antitoxin module